MKNTPAIGETLVLPTTIELVKIMFGEPYAKQLRQIPLTDNTVIYQFALQVDEASDVAKDEYLIAYPRYKEKNITQDVLFCKPVPGKVSSSDIFNIIDTFLMRAAYWGIIASGFVQSA